MGKRNLWERCCGLVWTRFRLIPPLSLLCKRIQAINPQFQPSHPAGAIADGSWGHVILLVAELCTCVMGSAGLNTEPVQSRDLAKCDLQLPRGKHKFYSISQSHCMEHMGRFRESGGCLPAAVNEFCRAEMNTQGSQGLLWSVPSSGSTHWLLWSSGSGRIALITAACKARLSAWLHLLFGKLEPSLRICADTSALNQQCSLQSRAKQSHSWVSQPVVDAGGGAEWGFYTLCKVGSAHGMYSQWGCEQSSVLLMRNAN